MKSRQGFVSNSSSSSFVIMGGSIEFDPFMLDYLDIPYTKKKKNNSYDREIDDFNDVWEQALLKLESFYNPLGMSVTMSAEGEYFQIGFDLDDSALHDKTINQIKAEAKSIMAAVPDAIRIHSVSLQYGEIST